MSDNAEPDTQRRGRSAVPTGTMILPDMRPKRADSMSLSTQFDQKASIRATTSEKAARARRSVSTKRYNSSASGRSTPEYFHWYRVIEVPFTVRGKRTTVPYFQHRSDPTPRRDFVYQIVAQERLMSVLLQRNRDLHGSNRPAKGEQVSSGHIDRGYLAWKYMLPSTLTPQEKLVEHRSYIKYVLQTGGHKKRPVKPGKPNKKAPFLPCVEHAREIPPHFWRAKVLVARRNKAPRTVRFERKFGIKGCSRQETEDAIDWMDCRATEIDPRRPHDWKLIGSKHWVSYGDVPPDFRLGSLLRNEWKPEA